MLSASLNKTFLSLSLYSRFSDAIVKVCVDIMNTKKLKNKTLQVQGGGEGWGGLTPGDKLFQHRSRAELSRDKFSLGQSSLEFILNQRSIYDYDNRIPSKIY